MSARTFAYTPSPVAQKDIAECFRRTAAIWRDSARNWRSLAAKMPEAMKFIALGHAERDDILAAADVLRAKSIEDQL